MGTAQLPLFVRQLHLWERLDVLVPQARKFIKQLIDGLVVTFVVELFNHVGIERTTLPLLD